jgi:F0F1-type ATP synthase assembly protein I
VGKSYDMVDKDKMYKRIKIAGLLSFIPFVLAAAPLGGWFLGEFLQKKFNLSVYVTYICILIGVAAGIREVVRIIRLVIRIDRHL